MYIMVPELVLQSEGCMPNNIAPSERYACPTRKGGRRSAKQLRKPTSVQEVIQQGWKSNDRNKDADEKKSTYAHRSARNHASRPGNERSQQDEAKQC